MKQGLLPYRDFAVSYTPLFLYSMYPFYLLGGANLASLPILLADAATPVAIYALVQRLSGERLAVLAGLAYAFSPFFLYYEGYIWFASQPMTLFMILATYFLVRDRVSLSFASLAVALLFKQEAIFLLPVFALWFLRRDFRSFVVGFAEFGGLLALVSAPFLILASRGYLSLVSYGFFGTWVSPVASGPVISAVCQNLYSNIAGTARLCTLGSISNSQFVFNAPPTTLLAGQVSNTVDVISGIVAIPLLLLVIPVLFTVRNHPRFLLLLTVYSGAAFVVLFSFIFHQPFKYYYVPVYGLLLACVVDKKTLAVATLAPVLSLVTFSGALQELIPTFAILAFCVILDKQSRDSLKTSATDSLAELDRGPLPAA